MPLPDIIKEHARGPAPFFYAIDLVPNAGDTWSTLRWSTLAVNIGGNDYAAGIISDIARISQSADIVKGGGIAKLESVDVKILNANKLHETFIIDRIIGRKAQIKIGVIPPNRLLNSSFETFTTGPVDFADWTEAPAAGGSVSNHADHVDGAACVLIVGGTSAVSYVSQNITFKRGELMLLSVYAKGSSGGETIKLAIAVQNSSGTYRYWNESTETWSSSQTFNDRTATTSFGRCSMLITPDVAENTDDEITVRVEIGSDATDSIYFDCAQIESAAVVTSWALSRYEIPTADVVQVFTGFIKSQKWDREKITIAADERWNGHGDIPMTVLTENTDSGWTVPADNLGKPFPMTYGNFAYARGRMWDFYTFESTSAYFFQLARGILANANPAATYGVEVYFDAPDRRMYEWQLGTDFQKLFHFDKKAGRYFEQRLDDRATPVHAGREFLATYWPLEARWVANASGRYWINQKRCAWMTHLKGEYIESSTGITNPAYAIDASELSYADHITPNAYTLKFKVPQIETEHSICIDGGVYVLGKYLISAGAFGGTALIRCRLVAVTASYSGTYVTICTSTGLEDSFDNLPMYIDPDPRDALETDVQFGVSYRTNFIRGVTDDMFVEILMDGSACTSGVDLRIYETGVRIDFATDLLKTNFCCQMAGRGYLTDWGSRRVQYQLITDAPDVVESILREELGVAAADIDTTMFDAAVSENNIECAGQLHDIKNSLDVIEQICFESGLLYYMDGEGKHTIEHLGWKTPVANITYNDVVNGTIKIDYTSLDDIANAIHVRFNKNQWSKEYALHEYADRSGKSSNVSAGYDTKCANCYSDLGNVERFIELEFDWIKHPLMAADMVEWFVNWLAHQRLLIECECFMDALALAIGKIVTLEFPDDLPASVTSSSRFVVTERRINRRDGRIGLKLLEVVEP